MTDPRGAGACGGVKCWSDDQSVVLDHVGQVVGQLLPAGDVAAFAVRHDPLVLTFVRAAHGDARFGDDVPWIVLGWEREHGDVLHAVVDQSGQVGSVAARQVVLGNADGDRHDAQLVEHGDEPVGLVLGVAGCGLEVNVGARRVDTVAGQDLGRGLPGLLAVPGAHDQQNLPVGLVDVAGLLPALHLAHTGPDGDGLNAVERPRCSVDLGQRTDHLAHVIVRAEAQLCQQGVPHEGRNHSAHLAQLVLQDAERVTLEFRCRHGGVKLAERAEQRSFLRGIE